MGKDALKLAEESLSLLRQTYRDDPKNYQLGLEVGRLTNRVIALARAAAPRPEYVRPAPPAPSWSQPEWADRLPDHCPNCQGWPPQGGYDTRQLPCAGYTSRYGGRGAQCRICWHTWELESEVEG